MEIVIGTYEELILAYNLHEHNKEYELRTSFTDHSHTGCVRTLAVSEHGILASGSSDESIQLFNLKKRKEVGSLVHHNGYIAHLSFFGKSHMFSCSADGTVGIWKTGSWECQKTLRGHKDIVSCLAVHPSGKMALSVSPNKMFTWNLITGKCAYITAVKGAELVLWTPDGSNYLITSTHTIDLYSVETATVIQSVKVNFRISCVNFVEDNIIAIGGDGGTVELYDLDKKTTVHVISTDTVRVKAQAVCTCEGVKRLVTGSSDGFVKVWRLTCTKGKWSSVLECSTDTKFRIISLAVRVESPGQNESTKTKDAIKQTSVAEKNEEIEEEEEEQTSDAACSSSDSGSDDGDSDESLSDDIPDSDIEKLLRQYESSDGEEGSSDDMSESDPEENQSSEDNEVKSKVNSTHMKGKGTNLGGGRHPQVQRNKKRKQIQDAVSHQGTKKTKQSETVTKQKAKTHQLKSNSLKKQKLKSKHARHK